MRFLPEGTQGNKASIDAEPAQNLSQLLSQLGVPENERLLLILNGAVVKKDDFAQTSISDGDELALMPPIQAG